MTIKSVSFAQKDEELVKKIEEYQQREKINFTEAVRRLCKLGLKFERLEREE